MTWSEISWSVLSYNAISELFASFSPSHFHSFDDKFFHPPTYIYLLIYLSVAWHVRWIAEDFKEIMRWFVSNVKFDFEQYGVPLGFGLLCVRSKGRCTVWGLSSTDLWTVRSTPVCVCGRGDLVVVAPSIGPTSTLSINHCPRRLLFLSYYTFSSN